MNVTNAKGNFGQKKAKSTLQFFILIETCAHPDDPNEKENLGSSHNKKMKIEAAQ